MRNREDGHGGCRVMENAADEARYEGVGGGGERGRKGAAGTRLVLRTMRGEMSE